MNKDKNLIRSLTDPFHHYGTSKKDDKYNPNKIIMITKPIYDYYIKSQECLTCKIQAEPIPKDCLIGCKFTWHRSGEYENHLLEWLDYFMTEKLYNLNKKIDKKEYNKLIKEITDLAEMNAKNCLINKCSNMTDEEIKVKIKPKKWKFFKNAVGVGETKFSLNDPLSLRLRRGSLEYCFKKGFPFLFRTSLENKLHLHHKNGDDMDDRIENLIMVDPIQHKNYESISRKIRMEIDRLHCKTNDDEAKYNKILELKNHINNMKDSPKVMEIVNIITNIIRESKININVINSLKDE